MRRYGIIVVFIGLILGCATWGKGRALSSYAPVGIVYVASNYDINWHGEEPAASDANYLFDNVFAKRRGEEKTKISKADELIDEADTTLRKILSDSGIAVFAEKETLINSRSYAEANINNRLEGGSVKAEGYHFINFRDKTFPGKLAQETGINSTMYVTFSFTRLMASGIGKSGTMRAQVAMTALIIDASGKTIYNKTRTVKSADKVPVSGGFYDEDELMELFRAAISDACYDFVSVFTAQGR
ncbi:MAG: hypothetical protein LBB78_00520 [Spirochaetaceae bacterium]|jgi:hypothetical protein|nr:hypothetical protein [Spirochaetaceae bacterium]